MGFGTVSRTLRPIKLGWFVHPNDPNAVATAIQTNSILWGGCFNPIIPTYEALPAKWQGNFRGSFTAKDIARGYVDGFDPDYVLSLGRYENCPLSLGHRTEIKVEEILAGLDKDGLPRYGVGIYDLLRYLIDEEFRYQSKNPIKVVFPTCEDKNQLFISSVFGMLPGNVRQIIEKYFATQMDAEFPIISAGDYTEYLPAEYLFPRRITCLDTKSRPSFAGGSRDYVFLMDSKKPSDVMDYWNLRASGASVIPVPLQFSQQSNVIDYVCDFIERNYYSYRYNPDIFNHTSILRSRNVDSDELKEFSQSLPLKLAKKKASPKYVLQDWYPRMWDEWARDQAEGGIIDRISDTSDHDFPEPGDDIQFSILSPKMLSEHSYSGVPAFANEIDFRSYGHVDLIAEVFPQGDESLSRSFQSYGIEDWRFSSRGPVLLCSRVNSRITVTPPLAETVMSLWLKSQGWEVNLSPSGRIAKQMIRQLGGMFGARILASKGVIGLLEDLSRNKVIGRNSLVGKLKEIISRENKFYDSDRFLEILTDANILQLGIRLVCSQCQQKGWFSLARLDYELTCPNCLASIQVTSKTPEQSDWAYRCIGPFSLPGRSFGAYTVLLTTSFLSKEMDASTTPIMSFEASKGTVNIEADLAMLYQRTKFRVAKTELIFAECKTNNRFKRKDIVRMSVIAREFPGAILVFATLNEELSSTEVRLIRPIVNQGRRDWYSQRTSNPILILTGVELLNFERPPRCWKNAGGRFETFATKLRDLVILDLHELCDYSQQLHLGLDSRHEWFEKRHKKRIKRDSKK